MSDIFRQIDNIFETEEAKKRTEEKEEGIKFAKQFYFIHADFEESIIASLEKRFAKAQKNSLEWEGVRRALKRIEDDRGENLLPADVNLIFQTLLQQLEEKED